MFSPPQSRECVCFADCVHLHSPYLPAYVTCPLLDSWRQYCLSFFEGFSTLCATAQQPLIICHVYSSSSQGSFDDKPEGIKSSNSSVCIITINASLLVRCDRQREGIDEEIWGSQIFYCSNVLLQTKSSRKISSYLPFLPRPTIPCQPLETIPSHILSVTVFKKKWENI